MPKTSKKKKRASAKIHRRGTWGAYGNIPEEISEWIRAAEKDETVWDYIILNDLKKRRWFIGKTYERGDPSFFQVFCGRVHFDGDWRQTKERLNDIY